MNYIIKQKGLYQNKVNSSQLFPAVTVKWAIVKATFKIELDISTQLMTEENANCPVDASKQMKKKKKTPEFNSTLALGVNEKYKVLIGDKEMHYWNLSSLEKC